MKFSLKKSSFILGYVASVFSLMCLFSCKKNTSNEQLNTTTSEVAPVSADKSTGIKIISAIEVNDVNPLNNLAFTLKNSGKPLIDMVVLFSSNINYDEATGKAIIHHNENVTHILKNKDKYLKPLKDKGIKVILSILGNHDQAGVANLSAESARDFAQKIKSTCDTYGLDGVFFDDEYSRYYQTPLPAAFIKPSNQAAARLCYETKKAMPDGLVMVYVYSYTDNFGGSNAIPEAKAGEYIDYALLNYLDSYDLTNIFPGLATSGWGMYSAEYGQGSFPEVSNLTTIRKGGYGAHLIFGLNPDIDNFQDGQLPALQNVAKYLFDDELVFDKSKIYSKDW